MATSADSPPPHPPALHSLDHESRPQTWHPLLTSAFPHKPSSFLSALSQMFSHPEHNTSWILRSDTLYDSSATTTISSSTAEEEAAPLAISIPTFTITRTLLRRFVPRNPNRDAPALQTCHFLSFTGTSGEIRELVVYLNHGCSREETPYYLPKVRGVGWLLSPNGEWEGYTVSLLYSYFTPGEVADERLSRTAHHLLTRAVKLAAGIESGYVKRVHHDLLVPREEFQDLYLQLRNRHAKRLVDGWREKTDPKKHAFEDLLIAAFLICLWRRMYPQKGGWKGFVDIGCGNGVLVDVLLHEGWEGYGFDARARKSWEGFREDTQNALAERILVPWILGAEEAPDIHDGRFEEGMFIISNHADELTPWTPILAAASNCPFLAIPCCSHDLSGAKKRFPPPKELANTEATGDLRLNRNMSRSTYASLCAYVEGLARDCGWVVETEVLRIPSTRNVGIIGRRKREGEEVVDVAKLVEREGGADGWREKAEALRKKEPVAGH
jgi:tRNASer (uridine44-2'-O)-methyltransferase